MTHFINRNIERVDFHDSYFEEVHYKLDQIKIKIDGGYLENYQEKGIAEGIIFDESNLILFGVIEQTFTAIEDGGEVQISKPDLFEQEYSLIVTTSFEKTTDNQSITLGVFRDNFCEGTYYQIDWTIRFKNFFLEWDRFILHKNWINETAIRTG